MTPKTAALYLRSSKDRSDVSIDAQRRALTDLARDRGLLIVREYSDTVESGKDEDRPGFQQLAADLRRRDRGWAHLLLLDTARLARRRYMAIIFEHEAEKHGVRLAYKSIPDDMDPITAMIVKSILQAMDEYHSLTSRQKGLAGMAENVRKGYRAGGRAPRGYRLRRITTGAVREGAEVLKSTLEPDEQAAAVAAFLRLRARGTPRARAAREAGLDLPATSLLSLEWNALTYAGHTVWNVHNEYSRGGYKDGAKRRPRAEWIIQKATHQALITEDEAERILAALESTTRSYAERAASPYILAGLLQSPDGKAWEGSGDGYYRLRGAGRGGKWVRAAELEGLVMSQIQESARSGSLAARLVAATRAKRGGPETDTKALHREIVQINSQISRTMELAAELAAPGPALRKIDELEGRRERLVARMAQIERDRETDTARAGVTEDQVRRTLDYHLADTAPDNRRRILDAMVERITLDPQTLHCNLHYRVECRVKVASPRQGQNYPVLRTIAILKL